MDFILDSSAIIKNINVCCMFLFHSAPIVLPEFSYNNKYSCIAYMHRYTHMTNGEMHHLARQWISGHRWCTRQTSSFILRTILSTQYEFIYLISHNNHAFVYFINIFISSAFSFFMIALKLVCICLFLLLSTLYTHTRGVCVPCA